MRSWRHEDGILPINRSNQKPMENKNQVQKRTNAVQKNTFADLKAMLDSGPTKSRIEAVMGKKGGPFISSVISAVNGSAALQTADPHTIIGAALIAASLDLPIVPGLGFAGIVPFWDSKKGCYCAQFQVMKKGYIQLAQRSGQVKTIHSGPVLKGQLKKYDPFTGEYEFQIEKESDEIIGYVAFMRLINGFEKFKYMSLTEVERHAKQYSQSYRKNNGKWADKTEGGFEQMCEKTVIKLLLSNYAPLSTEMQNAIRYDQAAITGDGHTYPDNDDQAKQEEVELAKRRMRTIEAINQAATLADLEEIEKEDISDLDLAEAIARRKNSIQGGREWKNDGQSRKVMLP
jgi:recombination protein RecT